MSLLTKFRAFLRRGKLDAEMTEEMRHHVELQTELNLKAGMSRENARYAALRQFGNVAIIQEQAREARGWVWLEQFGQDLRFAGRMLWNAPGTTLTAVLTLALGIGVNAALFAVYDIATLRPLPSREPDELVDIRGRNGKVAGGVDARFSYLDYLDYCSGTQAFASIAAVRSSLIGLPDELSSEADSVLEARPGLVEVQAVSGNYFSTLGAEIALGRDFLPEEAGEHSGLPVIVVSHLFWQTHLHGDPHVIGRTLSGSDRRFGGRTSYTIIGVTAPDFVGQRPMPPAGWIPLTAHPTTLTDRTKAFISLIGRMRAGVRPMQASADLSVIAERLAQLYPQERRAAWVDVTPGMRLTDITMNPQFTLAMSPVLIGFALVLVIACLNVANLLLARGIARQHEIGVRLVLGAGRGRLVRQLFVENLLLCVLGAGAALLFAVWALQALKPLVMTMLSGEVEARNVLAAIDIKLDRRIVGFGALLAVVAGLAAGLMPALHSVRRDGVFALKGDGSAFGRRLTPSRLRSLLLVGQVAVCLTMLAASGIMTGKLLQVRRGEAGFSTDKVYQVRPGSFAPAGTTWFSDPLGAVETLRTLPGVTSACLVGATPLRKPGGNVSSGLVKVAGGNPDKIFYNRISAGFFETYGVPLHRGQGFTPREISLGSPVVIVSEGAAKRLWPGREAVGQFLSVDATMLDRAGPGAAKPNQVYRDFEVVGVARDIKSNWGGSKLENDADGEGPEPLLWFPLPAKGATGSIFVQLRVDSTETMRAVERAAEEAGVPIQFQERLAAIVDHGLTPFRAFAGLSAALSGLALVLATVGLYGVMSFGVNQRVREIGVRLALGATGARVIGLFVRQGMKLVAWGTAFGLAGGAAFAVLLTKALPGARFVSDLTYCCEVFAVVTLFLGTVALVACWLPARRAAKVDPMVALRAE
jgi:predicted permease